MKYILGTILSLLSLGAFAEAIPFPTCVVDNQPVTYRSVPSEFTSASGWYGAVFIAGSDIIDGVPTIEYNSELLSKHPQEWTRQVMLHECGHLKLHARQQLNPPTKEYEADCYSADILKSEYGYKEEDFRLVIRGMHTYLPPDRIAAFRTCLRR